MSLPWRLGDESALSEIGLAAVMEAEARRRTKFLKFILEKKKKVKSRVCNVKVL